MKKDGTHETETKTRTNGCLDPNFFEKHNITLDSSPEEYMELFLPMKANPYGTKRLHDFPSIELLTKWTNQKAILAGAGKDGTCYKDFFPFTAQEFRQHIGLYIFHGLSPSPRVENNFCPDHVHEMHGNNFIYNSFGPNAERRHRHFKAFFRCKIHRSRFQRGAYFLIGRFIQF